MVEGRWIIIGFIKDTLSCLYVRPWIRESELDPLGVINRLFKFLMEDISVSTSNYLYVHGKELGRGQLVENSTLFRNLRGLNGEDFISATSSYSKNYQNCYSFSLGRYSTALR